MQVLLRCATSVALLVAAKAQDPMSRTGVVVDPAGSGAAATVFVVAPAADEVGEVVSITTAADGSFAVPASLGDHVLLFAATADRATPLAERRGPGPLGRLQLEPAPPRSLQLDGLDEWRPEGPLRVFVLLPSARRWAWQIPVDGQGAGVLPPLPPGDLAIELRASTDDLVWRAALPREPSPIRVALPQPVAVKLRIEDERGATVAGARVFAAGDDRFDTRAAPLAVRADCRRRGLGVAAQDGTLTVRMPRAPQAAGPMFAGLLVCEHPEHATALIDGSADGDLSGNATRDGDTIVVTLGAADPFRITVVAAGAPIADCKVQLFARLSTMAPDPEGFAYSVQPWRGTATTDATGVATFVGLPDAASELRLVVAAPGSPLCLPLTRQDGQEVDIATAKPASLRVTADGEGIGGMRVVAMPSPPDLQFLDAHGCEPLTVTDHTGRAGFVLPPGRWWLFAVDADGFAHGIVDVSRDAAPPAIEWTRTPWQTWRVDVVASGRPGAGARFDVVDLHWIDEAPIPAPDVLLPDQWLGHQTFLTTTAGAADAAGRLLVRWPPSSCMGVRGRIVATNGRASEPFDLEPTKLPTRIELP